MNSCRRDSKKPEGSTPENCGFALITGEGGLTLVELLVSLTIFALLTLSATISLSLVTDIVRRADISYAEETRTLSRLRDSLVSTFFYIGERESTVQNQSEFFEYFYGGPQEILFVTARPLTMEGLALSRLYRKGKDVLLVESPLYDPRYSFRNPDPEERNGEPILLFEGVEEFAVRYWRQQKWQENARESFPEMIEFTLKKDGLSKNFSARICTDFKQKKDRMEWLTMPF